MGLVAGAVRLTAGEMTFDAMPQRVETDVSVAIDGTVLNSEEFGASNAADAVVNGYRVHGEEVFTRLRGTFAIALWDERTRTLLLGRDRAGAKAIHYASAGQRLFFATLTKRLLANPEIDRRLDPAALDHYLAFLLTPQDRSIVRGIRKVPPAHYLRVRQGALSLHQYWRLPAEGTFAGSEDDAVNQLDALLHDVVAHRLAGDTPATVLLSGGVNSGLLAALAARVSPGCAKTLTVRFERPDADAQADGDMAGAIARYLGTDHTELIVRPDPADVVDKVLADLDEPFADASIVPAWHTARAASAHTLSVLAGDGDEIFGGCDRYLPPSRVAAFDRATGKAGRLAARLAARVLPDAAPGRGFLQHVGLTDRDRYLDAMRFSPPDARRALLSPDCHVSTDGEFAEAVFGKPFADAARSGESWPAQMMAFDFQMELPEDVLAARRCTGAAHGVECHAPLIDDAVVQLAASLPASMRIRGTRLKHLLRRLANRYLPAAVAERPSWGFGLSPRPWIPDAVFGDVLGSPTARQRGYLNPATVERLLRDHLSGARDHTQQLWALLVLETWERAVTSRQSPVTGSNELPVVGNPSAALAATGRSRTPVFPFSGDW